MIGLGLVLVWLAICIFEPWVFLPSLAVGLLALGAILILAAVADDIDTRHRREPPLTRKGGAK
jgi:hypothetical protein